MNSPRLLALAGSTRRDSFNRKLASAAARAAETLGAEVTLLELRDHPLPLFDEDLEAEKGPPPEALAIKAAFVASEGLLIASPEYNSSVSPVLKNALDWISRPVKGEAPLLAFSGKVATLVSASPGALGGLRGLVHLRSILGNIGVIVLPDQLAVGAAHDAFSENGALKDARQRARLESVVGALVTASMRLRG